MVSNVARALVRAASRLVSTLVFELSSHTNTRRVETRRGTHECVRHNYIAVFPNVSTSQETMKFTGMLVCLLSTASVLQAQPAVATVVNAASNRFRDLPFSGVAQGSLAVAYGTGLGPATIAYVGSFPLPTDLAGTSVSITVAGTIVPALMIYTVNTQIAFLVPSRTPTGVGQIRVTYNGGTSAAAPIEILDASPGIFTFAQNGSGQGVATDALNNAVITLQTAARPGQLLTVWTNGLGADSGDESKGPTTGNLPINLDAIIGGQKAEVLYKGRSGCCSGLDQVNLRVPSGVLGCYVPMYFRTPTFVSNMVTLPVSADGGPCPSPFGDRATFSQGTLELDHDTDSRGTTNVGQAYFLRYDRQNYNSIQILDGPPGTCIAAQFRNDGPGVDPAQPTALDAGPRLTISAGGTTWQLDSGAPGAYFADLGTNSPFNVTGQGTLTGRGGSAIGAFSATFALDALPPFQWPETLARVPVDQPLTFHWSGSDANGVVHVAGNAAAGNASVSIFCTATPGASELTIPADVLKELPKGQGFFSVEYRRLGNITGGPAALDAFNLDRRIRWARQVVFE
jgi:uncharacterized protein (TIGR03437 family)